MLVDITGLNKAEVLAAMVNGGRPMGIGEIVAVTKPSITTKEATDTLMATHHYPDYVAGRPIKTDFTTNGLDSWGYDRDNGEGALQRIVDALRSGAA